MFPAGSVTEAHGIPVSVVDRPIRTTLLRAWRGTSAWRRLMLVASLLAGVFESPEFVAAPITSLNPNVGAGMVTGLVQAWAGRPRVRDVESLLDDLPLWHGWWRNRVFRVLLVFLFSKLGSALETSAACGWLKNLAG